MIERTRNDFDIQLPHWLRHWGPVFLAWFCLLLSLSNRTVFHGFEEDELGTLLSLWMMVGVAALCAMAARNPNVDPKTRLFAFFLAIISGFAAVDEYLGYHEDIGEWVQDNMEWLPDIMAYWMDDILIIGGALVGAAILLWCVWRTGRVRESMPYIASAVVVAIAHGVLDLMSHGTDFLELVFPGASKYFLRTTEYQLGFGEEYCKVWGAWFVLLFVQRFLHRDTVRLSWSWIMFLAGALVTVSLWQVADPKVGVPYLLLGLPMKYIRNFHGFAELSLVWMAMTLVAWRVLRTKDSARFWFGLLYIASAILLAGGWWNADRYGSIVAGIADALAHNHYWAADPWAYSLYFLIVLVPGLAAGYAMIVALRFGVAGVTTCAVVFSAGAALLGTAGIFIGISLVVALIAAFALSRKELHASPRMRVILVPVVSALATVWLAMTLGTLLPNQRFMDSSFEFFRTYHQPMKRGASRR